VHAYTSTDESSNDGAYFTPIIAAYCKAFNPTNQSAFSEPNFRTVDSAHICALWFTK
jgi:hypothetical protein